MKLHLYFPVLFFIVSCKKNGEPNGVPTRNTTDTTIVKPDNGTGTATQPTFDLDPSEAPKFIKANYIEIDSIGQISMFRSGIGHDYSDDFEFCRSMKHYFKPKVVNWSLVKIFSPADGTVVKILAEWAGSQIHIRSKYYPAFTVKIFHVKLDASLKEGDLVYAGQQLGTHIGNQTMSDIAVAAHTSLDGPKDNSHTEKGLRLVSYFQVMPDSLFQAYQSLGVPSRENLMISKASRDNDPLHCSGEAFGTQGSTANWIKLN